MRFRREDWYWLRSVADLAKFICSKLPVTVVWKRSDTFRARVTFPAWADVRIGSVSLSSFTQSSPEIRAVESLAIPIQKNSTSNRLGFPLTPYLPLLL